MKKAVTRKQLIISIVVLLIIIFGVIFLLSLNMNKNRKAPSVELSDKKETNSEAFADKKIPIVKLGDVEEIKSVALAGDICKYNKMKESDKELFVEEFNKIKDVDIIPAEKSDFYKENAMGSPTYQYTMLIDTHDGFSQPITIQMNDTAKNVVVSFMPSLFLKSGPHEQTNYCIKVDENGYFTTKKLKQLVDIKEP